MTTPAITPAFSVPAADQLNSAIANKTAIVGVIGLGYVGLPLAITCAKAGFQTIGFDIDENKITQLESGNSYIEAVSTEALIAQTGLKKFRATTDFTVLTQCDIIIICVPTPLDSERKPDLHFVTATTEKIRETLRPGQLIVLESTTYPGTTQEVVLPILQSGALKSETDFFLGYSPEREDPGNSNFNTASIPKVVAGHGEDASALVERFYGQVVEKVVRVSSLAVAEAVKITENVFRAVNIALVNELKLIYDGLDIDVWEVIDAAATKPFGYMPFYPGPGLGGHCIPIDPFYLAWKARENGMTTRFIELAGEINVAMPAHIISRLQQALAERGVGSLKGASVLVLGLAYKKNIPDIRESPSLALLELLSGQGVVPNYHDPYVAEIPSTREYAHLQGVKSIELNAENLADFDAVIIATDHDNVDYAMIAQHAKLVIDTRNAINSRNIPCENLVKA